MLIDFFLKYSIAIPFLIILLTRASSRSCVYNRKTMLDHQENVLTFDINYVKQSLSENFTTVCKTKKDTSPIFLDLCNNSAKVDETQGIARSHCYNNSRNVTFCCQYKNLAYMACLLKHHTRNLKRHNSSTTVELYRRLTILVQHNDIFCLSSTNKRQRSQKNNNGKICKEIYKLNETLERYTTSWQEFRASINCT
ncbi:uncharacterized protein LOC130274184 isoform X2 [Hyla sarda]|uniref:uncharacterized protein LOC130274184 isoform X2 n=1 Tax=Hyla sarda TaxID=327740 RepID=UPI0024C2F51B|nr:uncharacterized protein LOC130274184 isoform X2 [Hyla sarda]